MIRAHVLICGGTGCTSSGSQSIQEAFAANIEANGLTEEVKLLSALFIVIQAQKQNQQGLFLLAKLHSISPRTV